MSSRIKFLSGSMSLYLSALMILVISLVFLKSLSAQDVVPFGIAIEKIDSAIPGETISFDVVKTAGSEEAWGFDFMIGYDRSLIYGVEVYYGELFEIPGEYEWELFITNRGPFSECTEGGCPSGLIEIMSMADINNGPYHPKMDPLTGKIEVVPDNVVLFTLKFKVVDQLDPDRLFVPVFFFWTQCPENQIAFTYEYDSRFEVRSAYSRFVYDYDGYPEGRNIADYYTEFPSYFGAPQSCIGEWSERLCDFHNGGFSWGCGDTNGDGSINILDVTYLINHIYKSGPAPSIIEFSDVNRDESVDILDIVYLIEYLYKDGPLPQCPNS